MTKYIKDFLYARFDEKKLKHNLLLFAAVFICILICLSALPGVGDSIEYPLESVSGKDWWVQQLDAFEKGQVHLDIPVDPGLLELENPYDRTERENADVEYPWDRAFYDGKFYSYFGIAPILTVYYPVYLLTGNLPSVASACLIISVLAMLALGLAYREFVIRFCRGASLWLVLLLFFGVAFSSGIFIGICWSDSYYVAVLSAIEWLAFSFFFALRGLRARGMLARSVLLALSALAMTMTVWSRPTVALLSLAIIPLCVEFLADRKVGLRDKLISSSVFLAVLAVGAVAVMLYNVARFGSPFDFGASYQLTVSDISKNKLDISMFWDAIFQFFARPAEFFASFPFFFPSRFSPDYGRYFYSAKTVGAFAFGLPLASLAAPFSKRAKKDPAGLATVVSALVLCTGVAFFDYCYAGLDMRYVIDILPILSLFGAVGLLNIHRAIKERSGSALRGGLFAAFSIALCVISVLVTLGITSANASSHIF